MAFVVIADGAAFFVKFDGGFVPFKDLKIDALKALSLCISGNRTKDTVAEPEAAKFVEDIKIFEVIADLSAKACKIRKEKCVGDGAAAGVCDDTFDKSAFAEHCVVKFFVSNFEIHTQVFELREFAHQFDDRFDVFGFGFSYFYVHKKWPQLIMTIAAHCQKKTTRTIFS